MKNIIRNTLSALGLIGILMLVACSDNPVSPNNNTDDKNPPQSIKVVKIVKFWADPDSQGIGKNINLNYIVENATGGIETKLVSGKATHAGSNSFRIDSTSVFQLVARGKGSRGQDSTATANLMVKAGKREPPKKNLSILITPGGITGDGVGHVGFDQTNLVDDVSLLRTWTVWTSGDSVRVVRRGLTVVGPETARITVTVNVDTIPKWYQSWETPVSDFGKKGNFQASFRLRATFYDITLSPLDPFFTGDTHAPALARNVYGKEEQHPITLDTYSGDWNVTRVEIDGIQLFGKRGAPNVVRLHVAPAPPGYHESWRKPISDAQRDGIFAISWWKD